MKNTMNLLHLVRNTGAAFLAALLLAACSKNDIITPPPVRPGEPATPKIQFVSDAVSLSENGHEITVELVTTGPVNRNETIELVINNLSAVYGRDYVTTPAAENGRIRLSIAAGASRAQLQISPVNNNTRDPQRNFSLGLQTQGTSLIPEGRTSLQVVLADDEGPGSVSFTNTAQQASENEAQEQLIPVRFTPAAAANGVLELRLQPGSAVHGQHFTLTPAPVNNLLRIPVTAGQTETFVRLRAVNDAIYNEDRQFRLQLATLPDGMEAGSIRETVFTLRNDDPAPVPTTPIGQLRSQFQGGELLFWIDLTIQGVVTSTRDNFPGNVAYVEDESGGMALRFSTNHSLQPGERVSVQLQGAAMREVNGILEIQGLAVSSVQKISTEIFFIPEMSLAQLYASPVSQEGRLITLSGGRFPEANGFITLLGDRTLFDGTRSVTVRTEPFANFRNQVLPAGPVSVTGILAEQAGRYIIYPISGSSIR